jgi:hypothetical protein
VTLPVGPPLGGTLARYPRFETGEVLFESGLSCTL